jgi:hypothetical protein
MARRPRAPGLVDGRERDVTQTGEGGVVVPEDRHVARDDEPRVLHGVDRADGRQVVRRAERRGGSSPRSRDVAPAWPTSSVKSPATIDGGRPAQRVPNSIGFHVVGSEGSVRFDSVHPDEPELHQRAIAGPEAKGPRTITGGPEEPSFGYTIAMPARGVGSGYGAAFVAQAQDFLAAIAHGRGVKPDFCHAYRTMLVCDAAQQAAADGGPVAVGAPA